MFYNAAMESSLNTTHHPSVNLDALPRTIELRRNEGELAFAPLQFPYLRLLDQTRLPDEEVFLDITDWREVIEAIKRLAVRGAPAIGVAGAAAVVLRAAEYLVATGDEMRDHVDDLYRTFVLNDDAFDVDLYLTSLEFSAEMIARARSTAVNLQWGVDQAMACVNATVAQAVAESEPLGAIPYLVVDAAFDLVKRMEADDEAANRRIGGAGAALLPENCRVLTHCNAGSLATVFYGTALGVVYAAAEQGKIERVWADETRPLNQGARLSAYELSRAGIPVTLLCDSMAASVMARGLVDVVIVGADRIAANGDVANKIGTLGLAILARHFSVPFYVAAPLATFDATCPDGAAIPIEQRDGAEVMAAPPDGVTIENPAFDVTPADLITAIITDRGVFAPAELAARVAELTDS